MYARWLLAILILGLSFAVAYWAGMVARKANPAASIEVVEGLAIAAADLDLGEVWEERGVAWRLPIRNVSAGRIEIHDFIQTCACTDIKPRRLSLAAGETATIDLALDLTHRSYSESGQSRRPFSVVIYPVLKPKARPRLGWKLHGTIVSRITLDTLAVDFGERPIHGETPATQKVLATVHVPCQHLEVVVNPEVATAKVSPYQGDESRFKFNLAINSDLSPGNFQTDARIFVVSPTGEKALGAILPVSGKMQPEIRLVPSQLLLESKPVGEIAEAIITLQGTPDTDARIDHIEIDSPDLRVEPVKIDGIPHGRTFRVRQKVTKAGDQIGEVRFVIRKPGNKLNTLPIRVSCRGEANTAANTK